MTHEGTLLLIADQARRFGGVLR